MGPNNQTLKFYFTLAIFLAVFTQASFTQDQFRLSDYVNPDYHWKQLNLGFNLAGNNNLSRDKFLSDFNSKQTDNSFSSGLVIGYYSTKNSIRYQGKQDISFGGNFNSAMHVNKDLISENRSKVNFGHQEGSLTFHFENRFYGNLKKFFESDLILLTSLSNSSSKYNNDEENLPFQDKNTDTRYYLMASLPLLAGKGRIEEVQDARLAVYILDDLTRTGNLTRNPSADEITRVAEFITQLKNQRYFDSRIRKIEEITALDSVLTAMGLKANSGASYYTLINDNWDNSNGPVRHTGWRLSAGIRPGIDWNSGVYERFYHDTLTGSGGIDYYTHKQNYTNTAWNLDAVTGFLWEHPANLYWQHSFSTDAAYSLFHRLDVTNIYDRDSLTSKEKDELNTPNLFVDLEYKIGYYPNSRTSIALRANTGYAQYWGNEKINDDPETDASNIQINTLLILSCYYYMSPQLRFTINLSSRYAFTRTNKYVQGTDSGKRFEQELNNSLNASLVYMIF